MPLFIQLMFIHIEPSTASNSPRPVTTGNILYHLLFVTCFWLLQIIITDVVARRLVAGALGMRAKVKSEKEQTQDQLKFQQAQEAKEKAKRLVQEEAAKKEKVAKDIWDM